MTKLGKGQDPEYTKGYVRQHFGEYDPGPPPADWQFADSNERLRADCGERIKRFATRQARALRWISVAELAEWHATNGALANREERRQQVYDGIARDLREGRFEERGRCRVLFLSWMDAERSLKMNSLKMSRHRFDEWLAGYGGAIESEDFRSDVIEKLWMSRELCLQWCARRGINPSPSWIRERSNHPAEQEPAVEKGISADRARPGPRSNGPLMRDALKRLHEAGRRFESAKEAHRAVLSELKVTSGRGWSYHTFVDHTRDLLSTALP